MGPQHARAQSGRLESRGFLAAPGVTLLVSLVAHLAFVPFVVSALMCPAPVAEYTEVEFAGLVRDLDPDPPEEPEPEYDPDVELPNRQVVDAPRPDPEEARDPDDEPAEWISDKSVRVKKQQKSSTQLKGKYHVGATTAGPAGLTGDQDLPGIMSSPTQPGQDFEPAEEGTVLLGESPYEYDHDPDKPAVNLQPTFSSFAAAVKGSGIDALEDVEEGPKTLLDTDEWQYAGFFNRVKNAVAQHWNPGPAYSLFDPTGRVYGYKDRETVVKVVLECDGKLKHTYIKEPSGAEFLDEVAVKAISKAAPFKNPPKALCDEEEQIIAFNFGFLVKVGDSSLIKVKKY